MICLFIGGPADGKRLDAQGDMLTIRVPERLPLPTSPRDFMSMTSTFKTALYHRTPLQENGEQFWVYLHEDAPSVIRALINGYKGQ
jgi:hypothetical protein